MANLEDIFSSKLNVTSPRKTRYSCAKEPPISPKKKMKHSNKSNDEDVEPTNSAKRKILKDSQVSKDENRGVQTRKRNSKYFYYESYGSSESDSEEKITEIKGERKPTLQNNGDNIRTPLGHVQSNRSIKKEWTKSYDTDEDLIKNNKTPKNKKSTIFDTPNNNTPASVKSRARLIKNGVITPSIQNRENVVTGNTTPLMKARSHLHVSQVPTSLPCRETEYSDIYSFLKGKLLDKCGGCMYISGVPGTGKTATVTSVINRLLQDKSIPDFKFISINGMRITEPRQSYVEILKQLTGEVLPWEQAQSMLDERFSKTMKTLIPTVMLIDELDILCNKRQDVVYNLLDWPTKAKNQLIVVTIANTMDLPERLLMSRVTSRLGLTRLTFQAYTHKQLQEIVTKRLAGTNSFNSDAIQFVARKVASVSGDARRALDICRRAAEIAEVENESNLVTMQHVNEALNAMITQPKVRAIKHCSLLEQLFLQAIVAEVERTGIEETAFINVYKMLVSVAALDGFKMVSCTTALGAMARLSASRLILTDSKFNGIYQKIILNVSSDDVHYALKN